MYNEVTKLAIEAGKEIMKFYDEPIEVEVKSDDSPLTKADLAAHHAIVAGLKEISPNIPIISEEGGIADYDERKNWKKYWLVDPLDGTKEFIKKNGEFTVNIALIEDNIPVFGVVHLPVPETTYFGSIEEGSFKITDQNEKQRIFSTIPDKDIPVRIVSSRSHGNDKMDQILADKGIKAGTKVPAGSSLKFCLVAEGKADIYPRLGPTMEWDTGAGDAVFRYSGKDKPRESSIKYNKENLLNSEFIVGLD